MNPDAGHEAFFLSGEVRVKICGITTPGDAQVAVEAGADAIGINLFPESKRFVKLNDDLSTWLGSVPVTRVAVVVNPTVETVGKIADAGVFDAIQFHGDEDAAFCARCRMRWIRAVRVENWASLVAATQFQTSWFLLDSFSPQGYGGTGVALDLRLAEEFVRARRERRVILAGGLRPDTVAQAVSLADPHGVDVASGVEAPGNPRRKDAIKVRDFVAAAKGWKSVR